MNEFLANIGNFITQIHWSTWIAVVILIGFSLRGFKRGMAKELIELGFLILSLLIAWLFYNALSTHELITWLSLSPQLNKAIAFGVIFMAVEATKMGLYKITAVASSISNPCALNKGLLIGLLLIATAIFNYYNTWIEFNIITALFASEFLRSVLSLALLFLALIGLFVTLSKLFNFSISTSSPCVLGAFIRKILTALATLNNTLNATNIIGKTDPLLGAIIGLMKGFAFIIVMILILQNIDTVTQQYFWVESQGLLQILQEVADYVKPELSHYLPFINNN